MLTKYAWLSLAASARASNSGAFKRCQLLGATYVDDAQVYLKNDKYLNI